MRLVAEYEDVKVNLNNIKMMNLRAEQSHYSAALDNDDSDDILNLDNQHSTLREITMDIKTWSDTTSNLLHAVNTAWRGDKIIFRLIPFHTNEANLTVDGLIPFLRAKYGDEVLHFSVRIHA